MVCPLNSTIADCMIIVSYVNLYLVRYAKHSVASLNLQIASQAGVHVKA